MSSDLLVEPWQSILVVVLCFPTVHNHILSLLSLLSLLLWWWWFLLFLLLLLLLSSLHIITIIIWLVVWNLFYFCIQLGIVIPIDFHIFQRHWNYQPVLVILLMSNQSSSQSIIIIIIILIIIITIITVTIIAIIIIPIHRPKSLGHRKKRPVDWGAGETPAPTASRAARSHSLGMTHRAIEQRYINGD